MCAGIETVTVYAFSIENFKRSQQEVNALMELAMNKFEDAVHEKGGLHKHRVRLNVLGDISLLPAHVQRAAARVTLATRNNDGPTLNVCLSYTARQEMESAIATMVDGVHDGRLQVCHTQLARLLCHPMATAPRAMVARRAGQRACTLKCRALLMCGCCTALMRSRQT
eukprot:SAG31_NODE_7489_length_1675_cov_1.515863_2_plen_168_part_00